MTNNGKKLLVILLITGIMVQIVVPGVLLGVVFGEREFQKNKKIKFFSNDNNYHHLKGKVEKFHNYYDYILLSFYEIELFDKGLNYDSHDEYSIYSPDIEETWKRLDLQTDLEICFIAAFQTAKYSGFPIVQVSIDENEILSFTEGKEALIKSLS